MPTLDTNVILRWMLDDVPAQTEASDRVFGSAADLWVPDVALVEAVFVMERVVGLSRPTICSAIEALVGRHNIRMDRGTWSAVLERLPKLSLTDIYLAVQASAEGAAPLLTFDKKLARQMEGVELL